MILGDGTPHGVDYYARDECDEHAYIWVRPDNREDAIRRVRAASLLTLVDIIGGKVLVKSAPGEDVRSLIEAVGRDSVELAHGSKYPSTGMNLFERQELAEEDVES